MSGVAQTQESTSDLNPPVPVHFSERLSQLLDARRVIQPRQHQSRGQTHLRTLVAKCPAQRRDLADIRDPTDDVSGRFAVQFVAAR